MIPYHVDPLVTLHLGDCLDVLPTLEAESVDAVVTDPPAGIAFMSKHWDRDKGGRTAWVEWMTRVMAECYRVVKPGGFAVVWSIPRTCHWTGWAIEDAGFRIVDQLAHVFASGFPKGKTQLKPAREDWWLARKPGPLRALNIDGSRIGYQSDADLATTNGKNPGRNSETVTSGVYGADRPQQLVNGAGRWPSNVLLGDPELFDEPNPYVVGSGATTTSGDRGPRTDERPGLRGNSLSPDGKAYDGDSGGYSRFFVIPKADRSERERGLAGAPTKYVKAYSGAERGGATWVDGQRVKTESVRSERANVHPTVKPLDLMRHLVKLVTPPRVNVVECTSCGWIGHEANLPAVRRPDPVPSEQDVLLERLPRDGDSGSVEDVPDLRDGVLGEGSDGRSNLLLPGMRPPSGDVPAETVRGVRSGLSTGSSSESLLLEEMLGPVHGTHAAELPGVAPDAEGLHSRTESRPPDGDEDGVHPPASPDHGRSAGSDAGARRGGRPHQRGQGRQPAGEPSDSDEGRARSSQEAARSSDPLPSLQRPHRSPQSNEVCGGLVVPGTRPGVCLDPFAGSGTTGLAASELGIKCILIERERDYCDIAVGRLMATPMGLGLDVPITQPRRKSIGQQVSPEYDARRKAAKGWGGGPWATDPKEEPAA